MIRVFSRGFSALAIVMIGATVASAFPIQNTVVTYSHGTNNTEGVTTVIGLSSGTSLISSGSYRVGGFTSFATAIDNSNGATPEDNFLFESGAEIRTYCLELTGGLQAGTPGATTRITKLPDIYPPPSGWNGAPPSVERAAYIAVHFGGMAASASAELQAATQLAIWEVMYDLGSTGYSADWATTGSVKNSASSTIQNLADNMLQNSRDKRGAGFVLHRGVSFDATEDGNNDQTLLYATSDTPDPDVNPVPEPSTLAIAGLSGLALLGVGLRRRRAARA